MCSCFADLVDNLPDTEFHYVDARSVGDARKQAGVRVVPLLQVVDYHAYSSCAVFTAECRSAGKMAVWSSPSWPRVKLRRLRRK